MPRVPTYQQTQQAKAFSSPINSNPGRGSRIRARSPGGGGGNAMSGITNALLGLADHFEQQAYKQDVTRTNELQNEVRRSNIDAISQLNSLQGKEYLDAFDSVMEQQNQYKASLLENENERVQEMAGPVLEELYLNTYEAQLKRKNEVQVEYDAQLYKSNMQLTFQGIVDNFASDSALANGLTEIDNLVEQRFLTIGSDAESPDVILAKNTYKSSVVTAIVDKFLDSGKSVEAEAMLTKLLGMGYTLVEEDANTIREKIEQVRPQEALENGLALVQANFPGDIHAQREAFSNLVPAGTPEYATGLATLQNIENSRLDQAAKTVSDRIIATGKPATAIEMAGLDAAGRAMIIATEKRVDNPNKPTTALGYSVIGQAFFANTSGEASDLLANPDLKGHSNWGELKGMQEKITTLTEGRRWELSKMSINAHAEKLGLNFAEHSSLIGHMTTEALLNVDDPNNLATYLESNMTFPRVIAMANRDAESMTDHERLIAVQLSQELVLEQGVDSKEEFIAKGRQYLQGENEKVYLQLADAKWNEYQQLVLGSNPEWKLTSDIVKNTLVALTKGVDPDDVAPTGKQAGRLTFANLLIDELKQRGKITDVLWRQINRDMFNTYEPKGWFADEYDPLVMANDPELAEQYTQQIRERLGNPEYQPLLYELVREASVEVTHRRKQDGGSSRINR